VFQPQERQCSERVSRPPQEMTGRRQEREQSSESRQQVAGAVFLPGRVQDRQ